MTTAKSASDWIDLLGDEVAEVLRDLPFAGSERIPPPKRIGLPIGHELRILNRYLRGGTSSLDPSALWWLYGGWLPRDAKRCWRALVLREALNESEWHRLLGDAFAHWKRLGLLEPGTSGWVSRFAVVPVEDLRLVVDPQEVSFRNKVHIGQDSLHLLEFVRARSNDVGGRVLDVGTGSGILLAALAAAAAAEESVGIDINPRAARVARFNADANRRTRCRIEVRDALDAALDLGRFDRVVWNAPFMFYPEEERAQRIDGDGGELGIALTLAFADRLPALLRSSGQAWIMSAGPVLADGGNALEGALRERASRLGLDITLHVLQSFWVPSLRAFHERYGIRRFESVILDCRPGRGRCDRIPSAWTRRLLDRARGLLTRSLR